ncbi:MAG: quinone-dependent dihydroorotate dehydrogenase [Saprospiraceae bacterium]|uniref:Dihydroorotate dehydrogenase (quinone) n=1 Tax=Candidatus Opimibacter skivensis TaxID=2982028 RepID=A0A9D7XTA9_9BACT|nr:quinone-dependent dihydroorotate dehydrogenase [Candidatus Opimibacter skivensis]
MYNLLKFILFRLDPEKAHRITMQVFTFILLIPGIPSLLRTIYGKRHKSLERKIAGLDFQNPIGLAAGFDKDGKYFNVMSVLGFSHIEIGTVTPRPQPGNPKPRLFRLVKSNGLINRMGFNNDGAEALAERLKKKRPAGIIIGANIGKNKDTPNDEAVNDYLKCFTTLYNLVDYFTVNVSSPNTPGLRSLQEKEPLTKLLVTLQKENSLHKPIFLKIAPDLTTQQLDEIIEIVVNTNITGVIATNTTITREGLKESKNEVEEMGAGGLSGSPLLEMSVSVVKYLAEKSNKRFTIIGVGGIEDYDSAKKHLDAGADLIQIYTGLIYTGPTVVKKILRQLVSFKSMDA